MSEYGKLSRLVPEPVCERHGQLASRCFDDVSKPVIADVPCILERVLKPKRVELDTPATE